jgi:alpha-tubulin suppressor-like RCC1 family protein
LQIGGVNMLKKRFHFLLIFFLTPFLFNCTKLKDLADPYVPISLDSFKSLDSLTDQVKALGYVPSYTSQGGEYGLLSGADLGFCVVMRTGSIKCWGFNDNGQLGNGDKLTQNTPVLASALGTVSIAGGTFEVAVSSGLGTSCAFLSTSSSSVDFKCWGGNGAAQFGTGSTTPAFSTTPVSATILNGKKIKQFTVGDDHACVLFADDSSALCWGKNDYGQLGDGTKTDSLTGVKPLSSVITEPIRSIAASDKMTCLVTFSNNGYCWGNEGSPTYKNFTLNKSPTQILSGAAYVSGGDGSHICFIMLDQTVQCIGNNDKGQLGNGQMISSEGTINPVVVSGLSGASMIVAGNAHTCAVSGNNKIVSCWGDNTKAQLGNGVFGINKESAIPLQVQGLPANAQIVDIAASDNVTCVLLSNDDVYCWGSNAAGGFPDPLGVAKTTAQSATAIKILNRADP